MSGFDHAARRARLRAALDAMEHDTAPVALLVTGTANVRWACGFTGSNGQLLLTAERAVLVTDGRYAGRVASECPGVEVALDRDWPAAAVRFAAADGAARLVFEGDHVNHRRGVALLAASADADTPLDVLSTSGLVERERMRKDATELALLAQACAVTETVLDEVLGRGLVGRSERDVARALEDGFRAAGAGVAFPSIVAGGVNGAVPHHEPGDDVLITGQLVTIDCGALVDGYHADTTRTVAVRRAPGGRLAEVFGHVAVAQQAGVDAATVGSTGSTVDRACRRVLAEAGLAEHFVHGTGHGVGLEIHEDPFLTVRATASLTTDMALTVEPGVYLPGVGGVRIEDTVVTTEDGPRRLTHAPHDLVVV